MSASPPRKSLRKQSSLRRLATACRNVFSQRHSGNVAPRRTAPSQFCQPAHIHTIERSMHLAIGRLVGGKCCKDETYVGFRPLGMLTYVVLQPGKYYAQPALEGQEIGASTASPRRAEDFRAPSLLIVGRVGRFGLVNIEKRLVHARRRGGGGQTDRILYFALMVFHLAFGVVHA